MAGVIERLRRAGFDVAVDPLAFSREAQRRHLLLGDNGRDHSYFCTPAA
jgi:hypothetical protein